MKSADEWNEIMRDDAGYFETYPEPIDFIRAIQRDALQSAAEVCRSIEERQRKSADCARARSPAEERYLTGECTAEHCSEAILALLPPTPSATSGETI